MLYAFLFIYYNINTYKIAIIIYRIIQKGGDYMPNNAEIAKIAIDDFREIQKYMVLAKKENATETYAELKVKYISLKALLNSLGVNMADIDRIKE